MVEPPLEQAGYLLSHCASGGGKVLCGLLCLVCCLDDDIVLLLFRAFISALWVSSPSMA